MENSRIDYTAARLGGLTMADLPRAPSVPVQKSLSLRRRLRRLRGRLLALAVLVAATGAQAQGLDVIGLSTGATCNIATNPPIPGRTVNGSCVPVFVVQEFGTTVVLEGPVCPPGYELLADLSMHPKCAKDIVEPIK